MSLPSWLPNPLTQAYMERVTQVLNLRERARAVQRIQVPAASGTNREMFLRSRSTSARALYECYACNVGGSPINNNRNRYSDVLAYDRTRVILSGPEGGGDGDGGGYINANWVRERVGGKWHIATQAPLPHTTHAFLSLFMHPIAPRLELLGDGEGGAGAGAGDEGGGGGEAPQRPRTIVQLTQNVERKVTKGSAYFPSRVGESTVWEAQSAGTGAGVGSAIKVELVAVEKEDGWQHSTLRLAYVDAPDRVQVVRHLLFQGWPDHGVPTDVRGLLRFIKFVEACNLDGEHPDKASSPSPPLVIHCSAGVGRTGTYLALSSLFRFHGINQPRVATQVQAQVQAQAHAPAQTQPQPQSQAQAPTRDLPRSGLGELEEEGLRKDLVALEIDSLRDQRPMMVQTADQVRFVYAAFVAGWRLAVEVGEAEAEGEAK